jgi:hypothetical protein
MEELIRLSKQSSGIAESATMRDDEIKLWINAAIKDLKRLNIDAGSNLNDALIQSAIVMYVKSNFGMISIKDKELARDTYNLLCNNLSLSSDYKVVDEECTM